MPACRCGNSNSQDVTLPFYPNGSAPNLTISSAITQFTKKSLKLQVRMLDEQCVVVQP